MDKLTAESRPVGNIMAVLSRTMDESSTVSPGWSPEMAMGLPQPSDASVTLSGKSATSSVE